ncbi:MAG: DNA mismatch repair protein MutS [Bernardetiaceae bacterium]|nr:DNA mismatch repair protein MutS [Bernardetiaceae bacterium]
MARPPKNKTKQKSLQQNSVTPLMKQYNAIKTKHPGAILLFRVGDFYETFGEDAVRTSQILDIVLTKRANGSASEIELAGFPHHALDAYLPKLVRAGERVAICDQLEDPKLAKGIVKRGVTELVTPGLAYDDNVLQSKKNNFLASVYIPDKLQSHKKPLGLAFLDLSTGEFFVAEGNTDYIDKLLQSFEPAEVIYNRDKRTEYDTLIGKERFKTFLLEEWIYSLDYAQEKLQNHFGTHSLKGFGIEKLDAAITAAGAILFYLENTEHRQISHISAIGRIDAQAYMWLDRFTVRNLELLSPQYENGVPLIKILDRTETAMGGRLLRKWLVLPLKSVPKIETRHSVVEYFTENTEDLAACRAWLAQIGDLERMVSKVATGRVNPREMTRLRDALSVIEPLKAHFKSCTQADILALMEFLSPCEELLARIKAQLKDNPPLASNQGGLIKEGVSDDLDELQEISNSGKDFLNKMLVREIQNTGITSLKIDYNRVFGYYIEVRNTHKDKVPAEWIRKQTLTSAERYITEELKSYEEKILGAEDQIKQIEQRIYEEIVQFAKEFLAPIQKNASLLATLDVLSSFAEVALQNRYCKPQMSEDNVLDIKQGRHPVIEKQLAYGDAYIPNDVMLDTENRQILIVTGPNMSGKSALLRQTALIVLMAQIGSFVPAEAAHIGITDKIFTRVGASDNLSQGESTFMVEMSETASIMNNLSDRSLILMDEIGRGTSTYDGISIAWSIVEYLHNHQKYRPKTLFATHYHELNELENRLERVANVNVSVKQIEGKVVFLRKLEEGGSAHSFGIYVAQLAGMPNAVLLRAQEIMQVFESRKMAEVDAEQMKEIPQISHQPNMFQPIDPNYNRVKELLNQIDINRISPVEALFKLHEIQKMLKS